MSPYSGYTVGDELATLGKTNLGKQRGLNARAKQSTRVRKVQITLPKIRALDAESDSNH